MTSHRPTFSGNHSSFLPSFLPTSTPEIFFSYFSYIYFSRSLYPRLSVTPESVDQKLNPIHPLFSLFLSLLRLHWFTGHDLLSGPSSVMNSAGSELFTSTVAYDQQLAPAFYVAVAFNTFRDQWSQTPGADLPSSAGPHVSC